jgi:hypothetical protein
MIQTMYQQPSYLIKRGSVFYFSRRVPFALKEQFNKDRITISLRTGPEQKTINSALTIYPRGRVLRRVGGQVYSMFLYCLYRSSQGPLSEQGF